MREVGGHDWKEVFETIDPNEKAHNFHKTLIDTLDKHLKTKTIKITSLDKPWFNPALKMKYNEMQNEYFKNRKSIKWKKLRRSF